VLNPGAAWPNKRWPADRFGALAAHLRAAHGLPSLVLWGPAERDLADTIYAHASETTVLAPETSVGDVVAILKRATVMVSGDTGPLHLAAAMGTPVVGIYGPTDPARNGPWFADDVCECFHARRCHAARWCLDDIGVDEMARAVDLRMARLSGTGGTR
jgi:ADP-heptose:LPS heptosyltransferase